MLRKFSVSVVFLAAACFAGAQEASVLLPGLAPETSTEKEKPPAFTISGSADVYYRMDFKGNRINNLTSFTNTHKAFSLGMASVKLQHKTEELEMVADLGFGPRAREFAYQDEGLLSAVKQLYVSYAPRTWVKFTAGSWATHIGYELLDPQLNRNYSMSYLFTNGPFHHTGIKADFTRGSSGFMIGLANATDYRVVPDGQINRKFVLAQYSLAVTDNVKLFLNYVGGKNPDSSRTRQLDAVLTVKVSDKFNLAYNGTVNNSYRWNGFKNLSGKSWWGSVVYLNIDPQPWFGLTLRQEYFNDHNHLKAFSSSVSGGKLWATTVSANFRTRGLLVIPEFRMDYADDNIFSDNKGNAQKSSGSLVLAVIYSF